MTKLLHISDTHLGYRQYHNEIRREDFSKSFDQGIDIAIDKNVDAVIHTGDLFHSKNPNLKTQIEAVQIVKKLEENNIPFLAIVGNHERKRDQQFLDYMNMTLDNIVLLDEEPWSTDEVSVHGFDYIPSTQWRNTNFELEDTSSKVTIVCMHQLINPPVPELFNPYDSEDLVSKFKKDVDIIALGDYHQPEGHEVDGTYLYYPGSTEMTSKDEPKQKYVCLWEIEDGEYEEEYIPLNTRKFVDIHIDLTDKDVPVDKLKKNIDDVDEAVVHVTFTGVEIPFSKSSIKEILESYGAIITRVIDKRSNISDLKPVNFEVKDIESAINDNLSEENLSDVAHKIDDIVRDSEIKKSHVRSNVKGILKEESP